MPNHTLAMQLVVYAPGGPRLGILPYPLAASITDAMNDIGGGTIDYLADVQHSDKLENLCEVGVEVADAFGQWSEPGARYMRLKRGASVIEETRTRRYVLSSYGFQLTKVRMLREETLNENGERIISNATAGGLLKTLIDEAKARGNITSFGYTFTAAIDSAGKPWGSVLPPQSFRFGDDMLSLLRTLADNGVVDWRVVGRELRVYKVDGLGTNKSARIALQNGVDFFEAPDDEDGTELAGRVGVQGDAGRTYEAISPTVGPWGLWEEMVNASGIRDIGGLQFIGEAEQRRRASPRVQMTRQARTNNVAYIPFVDYSVGDTITAPDDRGAPAPLRVREIQITLDGSGIGANLTLNDRLLERDIKDRRTISGLLGSASSSAGGSGIPSAGDDKRKPGVPAGFVVSSTHLFTPAGEPFAIIDCAYAPVTTGADGAALDIARHELYGRENVAGAPWRKITEVTGSEGRITFSPMPAGEVWGFKVRAASRFGVLGDFTAPVVVELAEDTTPPDPPSAPHANSRLGVVGVSWDGLSATGEPMPIDFDRADVWIDDGAGPHVVGALRLTGGEDSLVVDNLPYGVEQQIWLTAIDTSGNESAPSDRVVATTKPLVDTDVVGRVIGEANVKLGAISEQLIKDGAISREKVASAAITTEALANEAITAGKLAAEAVDIDKLSQAVRDALQAAQDGADIAIETANGKNKHTFSSSGPSGVASVDDMWSQVAGNVIVGQWSFTAFGWVSRTIDNAVIANLDAGKITAGILDAARIAARSITSEKIAVNSITANELAANSITAAKIAAGAVTAGKIAADAVTAATLAAGSVTAGKIAASAVTATAIDAGAVTAGKIAAGTVTATELAADSVVANSIAANSVTTDKIAANSVTANELAANAVTADKIYAGSITAVKIAADAIDATKLSANAITAKHTITGALVRTAASGARTEMTNQGIRQLDATGKELVKIGYGIPTGMSLNSPITNIMTPLSSLVFGAQVFTAGPTASTNPGGPGVFGNWARSVFPTPVRAVSGRLLVIASAYLQIGPGDFAELVCELNRTPGAGAATLVQKQVFYAQSGDGEQFLTFIGLVTADPSFDYYAYIALRARGPASHNISIRSETYVVMPV